MSLANQREHTFFSRNQQLISQYNNTAHPLQPLDVGSTVLINEGTNRYRWNRLGVVVDRNNRKYTIRMHGSGRIVTRNRRHIKAASSAADDSLLLQPTTVSEIPQPGSQTDHSTHTTSARIQLDQ